jgi:chemotaxis signal transduction protein
MSEQATIASAQKDESQLVTFYLGEEEFGFDIMSVQEIIRQPKLSRIPMDPPYVEGVANLRGMVLPIIDTRTRFGMPRAEDTDRTRVLVVDVDGNKTGLRVDRVRQVTRVLQRQMEAPPPVIREGMNSDYLESVVKLDEGKRIIMALNPKTICRVSQEQLGKQQATARIETAATIDKAKTAAEDQSVTQLVTFKLGLEEFAFHMDRVREILRVERPSEVPGTPKHVLGVLTVRGNILPVIDLRLLLGLSSLESEVVAEAADLSTRFKAWLTAAGETVRSGAGKLEASGAKTVRKWMVVQPGYCYVARGDAHLTLYKKLTGQVFIRMPTTPQTLFVPSVNVMMESVLAVYGRETIGVLMTGIGDDGADQIMRIKQAGGYSIAESEESCVV